MFIHKLISAIKLSSELEFVLMILTTPPHQSFPGKTPQKNPKAIKSNIENINKKCLTRHYKYPHDNEKITHQKKLITNI